MNTQLHNLMNNHVGKANAITATEIVRQLNLHDDVSHARVRREIAALTADEDVPIASCNDGFYIIETPDELMEYLDNLITRIGGLKNRYNSVVSAFNYRML